MRSHSIIGGHLLLCYWLSSVLPPSTVGYAEIRQEDNLQGRRFGGYRIMPKPCKDLTGYSKETGICMFNYDCLKKNGSVVGSCTDGFLFGACCRLPPGVEVVTVKYGSSTASPSSPITPDSIKSTTRLVNIHGPADTVLLNEDGTIADNAYRPEDFYFNSRPELFVANESESPEFSQHEKKSTTVTTENWTTSIKRTTNPYSTEKKPLYHLASTLSLRPTTSTKPSYQYTSQYIKVPTFSHNQVHEEATHADNINHILSILNDTSPIAQPEPHPTTTSATLSTWVSIDSKDKTPYYSTTSKNTASSAIYTKHTTPSYSTYYTKKPTKKPTNSYTQTYQTKPTQIYQTNTHKTKKPQVTERYPSSPYTKDPPYSSNHYYTTKPSTTNIYIKPDYHTTTTTQKPPYHFSNPSSSTHYVPLPGFQVTPEISITPKPTSTIIPEPPPTVIVLGPFNSTTTKKPTNKPVLTIHHDVSHHVPGTIITVNTEGNIITYRPSAPTTTTTLKPNIYQNNIYSTAILPTKKPTFYPAIYTTAKPVSQPPNNVNSIFPSISNINPNIYTTAKPYPKPSFDGGFTNPIRPQHIPTEVIKDTLPDSTEVLIAFPPVRDPNINFTTQTQNNPEIISWGGQTTMPDYTTPQLIEDEYLDNKVHSFVEEIVQSLQGNFEDLENVLINGQSTSNVTVYGPNKRPTTTKKPSKKKPTTTVPLITRPPSRPVSTNKPAKRPITTIITTTIRPSTTNRPHSPTQTFFLEDTPAEPFLTTVTNTIHSTTEVDYRNECGVRPLVKNGRIVGGTGSTFGKWPWQVLVKEATWFGLFTKNKCGGVLITNNFVITAAHCQPGLFASLIAVFGEFDISGELESKASVSRNVKRIIVHRLYDPATFENDIALLELISPVVFDHHIVPICMPKDNEDFTGRIATVTGWGRLKYGGGVPSVLQEVQVPVIENNVCQEMFHTAMHKKTILSSFICAGYANGQRDSCEGDSGGPLMIERDDGHWTLAGTVSHGIKCAAPYLPGVYMRTTYYKPWLQKITDVLDL